ncbi:MAG TPA: PIG-L family deacetylase [Gelria sp.]|jgi:LmbE family N-acetylglucosaminyl deacetylase|nr:PIG-L family deacetylase [Gelria sp.]
MQQVLIVAPHPDDDIIGCGGSIAKHRKAGNQVTIMHMTSGDAGGIQYTKEELAALREDEAQKAAEHLSVNNLIFLRIADGYIEFNKENLIRITSIIRDIKPDIVYIPHSQEGNRDHRVTHQLLMEACHRAGTPYFPECGTQPWKVTTILGYEVWTPIQNVDYSEDISEFIEQKLAALQMHLSQLEYYRYDEAIKGLNRYRGIMTTGCDYSECFTLLKITM